MVGRPIHDIYPKRNSKFGEEMLRVEKLNLTSPTGRVLVEIDPRYFRLTEVDTLLGDASKAQAKLGWRHKTKFDTLVADMVEADMVAVVEERKRRNRQA